MTAFEWISEASLRCATQALRRGFRTSAAVIGCSSTSRMFRSGSSEVASGSIVRSRTRGWQHMIHWRTILLPPGAIDYVVVHGLEHLFEPHHTAEFWGRVEQVLPDFDPRKRWLAELRVAMVRAAGASAAPALARIDAGR